MSIKKDIIWRVGLVYLSVLLFAVVIASKLIVLQFIKGESWKQIAREEKIKNFTIPSHRGDIYADDMRLLASDVPYYEVRMDFAAPALTDKIFNAEVDSLAWHLSSLFRDRSASMYARELKNARRKGERYYLVKSNVNYLQLKQLKEFPIFRRGRYKGGVIYTSKTERVRPHEELASRTIGYTKEEKDKNGNITKLLVGLDGAYDEVLVGKKGFMKMQKLSGGVWMPIDGEGEVDPEDGSSIITTINVDWQDVAHKALKQQLQLQDAAHGTVVLMHVRTGDIKAIVNLEKKGDNYYETYNYAVGASTEPGSTFKIPVIITALEQGVIDIDDTIDTQNGKFEVYDIVIRDESYTHGGYGKITVQQVIEKSSNVGMAKIITGAYQKKPTEFVDRLYKMSLKDPLNLTIPGEGTPQINYPGDPLWSGVSLAQMAYGYEVKLTPLQILTFYNAIANDGRMVKPRFVKEIRNHGKIEQVFPVEEINPSICSRPTLKKVRTMLEGVVEHGTAENLKASHFKIAGKTGTTQIYNAKYGYKGGQMSYQASFVGYFPASDPEYSCIVVINAPSKNVYYGNRVAGPVFLEIANKVYATSLDLQDPLNKKDIRLAEAPFSKSGEKLQTKTALKDLGIKVEADENLSDWVLTQKNEDKVKLENRKMVNNLMPNLVSMGLKDALYLAENMGLKVEVRGRGSVRSQSIQAGSRISKGQKVILEMSFIDEL
ncbi:MAG: transpeptidase family protein [Bacteroidales bacterium]|nr:transpeptidase family protein [Bacteroidales bacterium]MBN2817969.1 transpeptidase family protein [Bacteroidales bacterium]